MYQHRIADCATSGRFSFRSFDIAANTTKRAITNTAHVSTKEWSTPVSEIGRSPKVPAHTRLPFFVPLLLPGSLAAPSEKLGNFSLALSRPFGFKPMTRAM